MIIAFAAFTDRGAALRDRAADALGCEFTVYDKGSEPLKDWVARQFNACGALVFVGAVGIAVRLISRHITAKDEDPAVIVIDEAGAFVIPVLSGHIGGANRLALRLSQLLGATPVITTATDINGAFAVDEWAVTSGCYVHDSSAIKHVSAAVLRGETVGFCADFPTEGTLPGCLRPAESGPVGVCVTLDAARAPFSHTCVVVPRIVALGVGCRKNTDFSVFEPFILEALAARRLPLKSVLRLASIDIKAEEPCILEFSRKYNIPFTTYTGEALSRAQGDFSPSAFVKATTGVDNVCERAAFAASGGGRLIIKKTIGSGVTLAAAVSMWSVKF